MQSESWNCKWFKWGSIGIVLALLAICAGVWYMAAQYRDARDTNRATVLEEAVHPKSTEPAEVATPALAPSERQLLGMEVDYTSLVEMVHLGPAIEMAAANYDPIAGVSRCTTSAPLPIPLPEQTAIWFSEDGHYYRVAKSVRPGATDLLIKGAIQTDEYGYGGAHDTIHSGPVSTIIHWYRVKPPTHDIIHNLVCSRDNAPETLPYFLTKGTHGLTLVNRTGKLVVMYTPSRTRFEGGAHWLELAPNASAHVKYDGSTTFLFQ